MDGLKDSAQTMLYLAFFVWVMSWFQISFSALYAERVAFKVRMEYFRRCIEKDADFYDTHNPTEMASRITKEVSAI